VYTPAELGQAHAAVGLQFGEDAGVVMVEFHDCRPKKRFGRKSKVQAYCNR
jgi:hypothetical protein